MNFLKPLIAATALAVLPMTASAVTLDPSNNISVGATGVDVFAGPYFFDASFEDSDGAGTYTFGFTNYTASSITVATVFGTVLQSTAKFAGGLTASWGNGTSKFVPDTAPVDTFNIVSTLGAGQSDTLTVAFGDPTATVRGGRADFDFTVAAVPVPAAGLLLLTALGGAAALRRRKKTVAA